MKMRQVFLWGNIYPLLCKLVKSCWLNKASLKRSTRIKLPITLGPPDCLHCSLDPSLYQIWKAVPTAHWIQSKQLTFLMQRPPLNAQCVTSPGVDPSVMQWERLNHMSSCSHPLRAEWLCLNFDPSKHYQSYLITVDTFSGYRIVVPVQSASSSHTTGPLKLICVKFLAFWAICRLTTVYLLSQKQLNSGLIVKVCDGISVLSVYRNLLFAGVLSRRITSSKTDLKKFLLPSSYPRLNITG